MYSECNRGILRFLKEKTYSESTRKKLRFHNRKTYSGSTPWTAGYITRNCRGSFANKPDEGVWAILDRWIESGWPRLERRGRESHRSEKKTGVMELHYRRRETSRSTWFGPQRPWFDEPRAQGIREEDSELTQSLLAVDGGSTTLGSATATMTATVRGR